jgi:hypothetical protein
MSVTEKKTVLRTFDDVIAPHPKSTQKIAKRLRKLVMDVLGNADEQIVGGAKVKLALYTHPETNRVMCGVQPAGETCLLYVHRLRKLDHPRLKLEGKGKHAKHIRFETIGKAFDDDVRWVLGEVDKRAAKR